MKILLGEGVKWERGCENVTGNLVFYKDEGLLRNFKVTRIVIFIWSGYILSFDLGV